MKKVIFALGFIVVGVVLAYATNIMLNYNSRVILNSASNRIVCVANPDTVSGGTTLIDETYTLQGAKSTINSSINIRVE